MREVKGYIRKWKTEETERAEVKNGESDAEVKIGRRNEESELAEEKQRGNGKKTSITEEESQKESNRKNEAEKGKEKRRNTGLKEKKNGK